VPTSPRIRSDRRVKEHQGAVLVAEVPFMFMSGEEPTQVWLLTPEDWKKHSRV
jgi:hypothetical protein